MLNYTSFNLYFLILWSPLFVFSLLVEGTHKTYEADNGVLCQLCPKGEYLVFPCEIDGGNSTCQVCPPDTFMDRRNNEIRCLDCSYCQARQYPVKECGTDRNRECQCKNGTFWNPIQGLDGACYQHSICEKGLSVKTEGTPWTDVVCSNKTTEGIVYNITTNNIATSSTESSLQTPKQTDKGSLDYLWVLLSFVLFPGLCFVIYRVYKHQDGSTRFSQLISSPV